MGHALQEEEKQEEGDVDDYEEKDEIRCTV
jgi:hypothetical protein